MGPSSAREQWQTAQIDDEYTQPIRISPRFRPEEREITPCVADRLNHAVRWSLRARGQAW